MVDNNATSVQNALQAGGIQFAMPQSVLSVPKTSHQVQKVMYDQAKLQALKDALALKRPTMSRWEAFANSLANLETPQSRIGGFGEEIINPWADAITSFARGFGNVYAARKAAEREAEEKAREDAIKAAQLDYEASKQQVTDSVAQDYIKYNNPDAQGDTSYRFEPEKIKELKELNDAAGRWATDWGKGISDMANTEQSKAYNEFEGRAKQYVQDQLKKIYGAQMTEAEGERFFKSMGLSPKLDPTLRWSLVENALDDLARKNNMTIKNDYSQAINDFMKGTK